MSLPRFSVRNSVAVNLLMILIIVVGLYYAFNLEREFFPDLDAEALGVTVVYPGAAPADIEKSVARQIEDAIEVIDGVEEVRTRVLEGVADITVELEDGADRERALNDLRTEIDRVKADLPDGAEDPLIGERRPLFPVIAVVISGRVGEEKLRSEARDVRDELLDLPEVTRAFLSGVRDRELWVEVEPQKLERYGLTFEEVGRVVARSNLDLPGGQLESRLGNVGVRTVGETTRASELSRLVVRGRPDGSAVRLCDLGTVRETFEDKVQRGRFQGVPAVVVTVFKTPDEDALIIADAVKGYVAGASKRLGGAVSVDTSTRLGGAISIGLSTDLSRFIRQRIALMSRNALIGLVLVLIVLAFFLDTRVAFWVAVGLPVSFLGTFILMDLLGASINLISLLGLIVVLGLIVDDAIVIGENVFSKMRQGLPPFRAAVEGAEEMTGPVVAAVLTTIAAFLPLAWIAGRIGDFLGVLPLVVISALSVSLVEALMILPAHLGHLKARKGESRFPRLAAFGERVRRVRRQLLEKRLPDALEAALRFVLHWRYASMAAAAGLSIAVAGLLAGGQVPFVLLQETDAETLVIDLEMAAGTPEERTVETVAWLEKLVASIPEIETVYSVVGTSFSERGVVTPTDPATIAQLTLETKPADERKQAGMRESIEVVAELRRRLSSIPGASRLSVSARGGGPGGRDLVVRVRGDDLDAVARAVEHIRDEMAGFGGVYQIEDDLESGKLEARIRLRESVRSLGLATRDVALQIRHALYGFEVQDLQEEDDEVTVRVLLPKAARRELSDLYRLRIITPAGGRVPLEEVASFETSRGYSSLSRVDGKRAVTVQAEVDDAVASVRDVTAKLAERFEDIGERFPGVTVSFEGRQKDTRESMGSLLYLFPLALMIIYGIIAVLFRSYIQPVVVMAAIPYGLVGAILGHFVMGYPFTILSTIGAVALTGILVNDSLILVDLINRKRRDGLVLMDAIIQGARLRMRPILLTSITTIAGLSPLMLETSFQAQFLIPMAISIVFGLALATGLTLVLLPTLYLMFEDVKASLRWVVTGRWERAELAAEPGIDFTEDPTPRSP